MDSNKINKMCYLFIIILLIIYFTGCLNDNPNPITKEELVGSWSYEDEQHKVLTWYFFENNSLLSNFSTLGGTSFDTWYSYTIKDNKLCFIEIGSNDTSEYCYNYDYIKDQNKLKIIQGDDIVYFERIL